MIEPGGDERHHGHHGHHDAQGDRAPAQIGAARTRVMPGHRDEAISGLASTRVPTKAIVWPLLLADAAASAWSPKESSPVAPAADESDHAAAEPSG